MSVVVIFGFLVCGEISGNVVGAGRLSGDLTVSEDLLASPGGAVVGSPDEVVEGSLDSSSLILAWRAVILSALDLLMEL